MAEQRARAKADAQAQEDRRTSTCRLYRSALDGGPARVHRLHRGRARGARHRAHRRRTGCCRRRGEGDEVEVVLDATPFYAEGGGQQRRLGPHHRSTPAAARPSSTVLDVQPPLPGPDRAPRRACCQRRGPPGRPGARAGRRRAPARRCRAATRRPTCCTRRCAARSATPRRRPVRSTRPGRLRFDFTTPAAVPAQRARRRRGRDQRGAAARPRGALVRHRPGRGAPARRDRDVRREVRRPGARRRDRRLLARAVRRHARRRAARSIGMVKLLGESSIGSGRAPGRGAGRAGRVPVPGPRARAGAVAGRRVQGASPRSCPSASTACSSGSRPPSRSSTSCGSARCWPAPARWPARPSRSARVQLVAAAGAGRGRRQRPARAGARRPRPVARRRPGGRAARLAGRRRAASRSSPRSTTPGRPPGWRPASWCGRSRRCSARAAAARPTSPRAPAATPPKLADAFAAVRGGRWRAAMTARASWLGVDVGTVRVGVARSDPRGVLAVAAGHAAPATPATDADIAELAALVRRVRGRRRGRRAAAHPGRPRGHIGAKWPASTRSARRHGSRRCPCEYVDERLTTVSAQRKLPRRRRPGQQASRAVIDQAAAVELLQHWLDSASATLNARQHDRRDRHREPTERSLTRREQRRATSRPARPR